MFLKEGTTARSTRGADARAIKRAGGRRAGRRHPGRLARRATRFYDHEGENRIVEGPGTRLQRRAVRAPRRPPASTRCATAGTSTLASPLITAGRRPRGAAGPGLQFYRYGFRKHPYASRQSLRAGYATGLQGFKFEYDGRVARTPTAASSAACSPGVSDVEIVRFHGFGNETVADQPSDFYKTPQRQFILNPSFRLGLDAPVDFSIGVIGKYVKPDIIPGRFLVRPYGDPTTSARWARRAALVVDGRNRRVGGDARVRSCPWPAPSTRRPGTSRTTSPRPTARWPRT